MVPFFYPSHAGHVVAIVPPPILLEWADGHISAWMENTTHISILFAFTAYALPLDKKCPQAILLNFNNSVISDNTITTPAPMINFSPIYLPSSIPGQTKMRTLSFLSTPMNLPFEITPGVDSSPPPIYIIPTTSVIRTPHHTQLSMEANKLTTSPAHPVSSPLSNEVDSYVSTTAHFSPITAAPFSI